jgi:hypothetical protein
VTAVQGGGWNFRPDGRGGWYDGPDRVALVTYDAECICDVEYGDNPKCTACYPDSNPRPEAQP